jgi:hypothetical protein
MCADAILICIMISSIKRFAVVGAISLTPVFAQESTPPTSQPGEDETKFAAADQAKLANLEKFSGLSGLKFGEAFSDKGFEVEQDRGALKIYKKEGAKLLMGPALLDEILYYVFDGKLYGVAFHTDDGQDSLALKGILINAFGMGQNSSDGGPSTVWLSKTNGAIFDLNTSTGEGSAFLFDIKLHDACLAEQSASAKTAAQQLIQGKL